MKNLKRVSVLFLAVLMMLATSMPALAITGTFKLTPVEVNIPYAGDARVIKVPANEGLLVTVNYGVLVGEGFVDVTCSHNAKFYFEVRYKDASGKTWHTTNMNIAESYRSNFQGAQKFFSEEITLINPTDHDLYFNIVTYKY